MPEKTPTPDQFGRLRVSDLGTGHELSIGASAFRPGAYRVLDEAASDVAGDALPPKFKSVETTGPKADTPKEK